MPEFTKQKRQELYTSMLALIRERLDHTLVNDECLVGHGFCHLLKHAYGIEFRHTSFPVTFPELYKRRTRHTRHDYCFNNWTERKAALEEAIKETAEQ